MTMGEARGRAESFHRPRLAAARLLLPLAGRRARSPRRRPRWRQARAVRGHRREEGAAGAPAAARPRVGASQVSAATRPRRGTAARACAARGGREASRPYLLPG